MANAKSPSDLDAFIGQRIYTARTAKGLSRAAVAQTVGVTFQQLEKYEKGMNRITAVRLVQIAAALECPLLWLYGKDDDVELAPTPSRMLAYKIERLPKAQRVAFEQMLDAMLAVLDTPNRD